MSTYGLSGSSPFADFTSDLEDIIINYLYTKWSIGDPAKPAALSAEGQDIAFRPGFDRGTPTYQVLAIQTDTEPQVQDNSYKSFKFLTKIEITLIANRMADLDNVLPQLGYMEREVQRIINQYPSYEIPGVSNLIFKGQSRVYDDIISGGARSPTVRGSQGGGRGGAGATWSTTRWKTRIFLDVLYFKDDIS